MTERRFERVETIPGRGQFYKHGQPICEVDYEVTIDRVLGLVGNEWVEVAMAVGGGWVDPVDSSQRESFFWEMTGVPGELRLPDGRIFECLVDGGRLRPAERGLYNPESGARPKGSGQ
jgi:hypothetical protein